MTQRTRKNLLGMIAGIGVGLVGAARADTVTNLSMVLTNNASLTWQWGNQYNVAATSADYSKGTVSGDTNSWIWDGSNFVVNAEANTNQHYHFLNWSNGPLGKETDVSLTNAVSTNNFRNLIANFARDQMTVNVNDGGYGTAVPNGANLYDYGTTNNFVISPIIVTNGMPAGVRKVLKSHIVTGNDHTDIP